MRAAMLDGIGWSSSNVTTTATIRRPWHFCVYVTHYTLFGETQHYRAMMAVYFNRPLGVVDPSQLHMGHIALILERKGRVILSPSIKSIQKN